MPVATPFELLHELLRADLDEGQPWEPEAFAQRVHIAVRESGAGRSWTWALIDTLPAWHDAYEGVRAGELEHFGRDLLDDDGTDYAAMMTGG